MSSLSQRTVGLFIIKRRANSEKTACSVMSIAASASYIGPSISPSCTSSRRNLLLRPTRTPTWERTRTWPSACPSSRTSTRSSTRRSRRSSGVSGKLPRRAIRTYPTQSSPSSRNRRISTLLSPSTPLWIVATLKRQRPQHPTRLLATTRTAHCLLTLLALFSSEIMALIGA